MVNVPMELPVEYHENGDGTCRAIYADRGSRLKVRFKKITRLDRNETLRTGVETYVEELVLIKKKKGSTNTPVSKATEADKRAYKREWDAYLRGESGEHGDSLSDLYGMRPQDLNPLRAAGIHTIQGLIDADETQLSGVDGHQDLQELARIWLKARQKEEENKNAIILVETYKARTSELEKENQALQAKLEEVTKPKKRGRPKKVLIGE